MFNVMTSKMNYIVDWITYKPQILINLTPPIGNMGLIRLVHCIVDHFLTKFNAFTLINV